MEKTIVAPQSSALDPLLFSVYYVIYCYQKHSPKASAHSRFLLQKTRMFVLLETNLQCAHAKFKGCLFLATVFEIKHI